MSPTECVSLYGSYHDINVIELSASCMNPWILMTNDSFNQFYPVSIHMNCCEFIEHHPTDLSKNQTSSFLPNWQMFYRWGIAGMTLESRLQKITFVVSRKRIKMSQSNRLCPSHWISNTEALIQIYKKSIFSLNDFPLFSCYISSVANHRYYPVRNPDLVPQLITYVPLFCI